MAADLCPTTGRGRLSYERAEYLFKQATKIHDPRGYTLHQLRHSRLTHLAEDGWSAFMLMGLSGHENIRSLGIAEQVHALALEAYDRMIGLGLAEISVDGCITKAPSGGERAGRSPVDQGKQGLKRSVASDAGGVPLGIVSAGANRHDSPLLQPTLQATKTQVGAMPEQVNINLDRDYDSDKTRILLTELDFTGEIARKGMPAPIQAGKRWVVERTHSWMNGYGKLRRCTEKNAKAVDFYPYLAAALVTLRMLIRHATSRYRWDERPTTRRLK